jgi:gluconate 2-dehydrogenase gamma chain
MAGQSVERREVLRIMTMAAAASGFPGFKQWVFAHDHTRPTARTAKLAGGRYEPIFFSSEEYATVVRLSELIIPSDGSPGAREAGVSEFIDFMVGSNPNIQFRFRYGLAWLNAHAARLYGVSFNDLGSDRQLEVLKPLAYKNQYRSGEEEGRAFFELIREYTVMGFYTSRVGLEQLNFPGLRYYSESPGCPHPDDPEHLHLPPPQI